MTNTKKLLGLVALSVWPSHAAEAPDGCFFGPTENAAQYTYVPDCGDTTITFSDFTTWYAGLNTCQNTYTDSGDGNYYMCKAYLNTTINGWQCNDRDLSGNVYAKICDYHNPSPPPSTPSPPPPSPPPPSPPPPSPSPPPGPGAPCSTVDFDFTVSVTEYDAQVLADSTWSYGEELADLVANFWNKEFPASLLTLNPSVLADFTKITEEGQTDQSYVLEYTIGCGLTSEVTPAEAYEFLMTRATPIVIGSSVASGIAPRTRSTSVTTVAVAPSPSPPPSMPCIDFSVDRNIYTQGVTMSNGATYTQLWCYVLKNSFEDLCKSGMYYIEEAGEYKRCLPSYSDSGIFRCAPSEIASTACAPSAPPGSSSSSSLLVDSSTTQVNTEGGDDCMSDGGIAGIAIAMFLFGGVIGAVGIYFYVKKNAPNMAIKSPGV
jgi:hypothetical protein